MLPENLAPWEIAAAAKRKSTLDKIPSDWRLSEAELHKAHQQRNITGHYIEQYLDGEQISITRLSATALVQRIREGQVSCRQVTTAFCRRAAVAHQIVMDCFFLDIFSSVPSPLSTVGVLPDGVHRAIACMRFSLKTR